MRNFIQSLMFLLGLLFCGCTADNSLSELPGDSETALLTGVFLDSAVEGLYFETATQSGYTNSKGEFNYLPGEKVSFYLGDHFLGDSKAGPVLTPISIVGIPKANINTPEVQYMAALLQTLDIDGDAKNGIKLEPQIIDALEDSHLRGRENATANILEIVKKVREKTGIELNEVFPEQAAAHLAETLGENFQLYTSLLPVLESTVNPFEPMTSVTWDHQINDEGRLLKSIRYENHPQRVSAEFVYTEYLEDGYPLIIEITKYELGQPAFTIKKEILYTEERKAIGFKNYSIDGGLVSFTTFDGIDANGHVVESKTFAVTGEFLYRETFERLENGNVNIHNRYSSETSTELDDLEIRYEFTYNEFGELSITKQLRPYKRNIKSEYMYREDNTLQQKNTLILVLDQNRLYSREDFYNEQEKLVQYNIMSGDWRSEYVEFYPNGDYKTVYTYYQDWLQEIAVFDEEGYGELKIWHLDRSGSYQIDFRDPNHALIKIEFYDDNGNYERTEYYENNELVRTEYA
ncbi:hypothetical protein [Christiangramia aestuarii]|uniref:Uncharacterized protein n=1 Tax=Christiangramia aestuarii TaxID=1028746 RepID=A0A7K1LQK3_9FLAO|nr:hypothetical protein [Christiangramia aestuarii]MUP43089.1 hypothetical protein [Christiangramia aestuarii]